MSEYQYYEFQAVDRKLTAVEMEDLRELSSRATITSASFINEYNYGDFRGSPETLMEAYFDAHVYVANWGTHRLMLRVPRRLLDEKTAAAYCAGRLAQARRKGAFVILDWNADEEESGGDWEQGTGWLASLIPIRAEILGGDLRALYLGWLTCAQAGELDDDDLEPEVPPGLARLTASLERFAEFLRIDPALVEVAAERSAATTDSPARAASPPPTARRTVTTLLEAAASRAEANARAATESEAKERAARETKDARAKKKRLDTLSKDEPSAWLKVEGLVAKTDHDEAVALLVELRDLAAREGRLGAFVEKLDALRSRHKAKQALHRRINKAGLRTLAAG